MSQQTEAEIKREIEEAPSSTSANNEPTTSRQTSNPIPIPPRKNVPNYGPYPTSQFLDTGIRFMVHRLWAAEMIEDKDHHPTGILYFLFCFPKYSILEKPEIGILSTLGSTFDVSGFETMLRRKLIPDPFATINYRHFATDYVYVSATPITDWTAAAFIAQCTRKLQRYP